MLLQALKPLAAMRMTGEKPADSAWLYVGDEWQPVRWWIWRGATVETVVPTDAPMERLDLRPLVGLRVIVLAPSYTRPLLRLLNRLKDYALSVDCFVLDWLPDDLGMRWERGQDQDWIGIGDQHQQEAMTG